MNSAERQAHFKNRMREKGLTQANEWIPETRKTLFREIAAALREGKDLGDIVPSNQTPDIVPSNNPPYIEAVEEYYRKTRAKDPKSTLERAIQAYIEAEIKPQIEAEVQRRVTHERERLSALMNETEEKRQFWYDLINQRSRGHDFKHGLKILRQALHPDRLETAPELRTKAMDEIKLLANFLGA